MDELIASSGGSDWPGRAGEGVDQSAGGANAGRELNHHLGYEKHEAAGYGSGNSRNGKSRKRLKGEAGEMTIEVPRDRNGTFDPS